MINVSQQFSNSINDIFFYSFSLGEDGPGSGVSFSFKAFLTDFGDQFNTNWTPQEIYGRMDPIFTYKNTIRKITLAFDVPSYDTAEAEMNAKKADKLIRALYPVYTIKPGSQGTALLSSPPLFKIKLANLILNVSAQNTDNAKTSGLLGWIDGFNFKPELDSGFFVEPDIKGATSTGKVYPKLFKVSFTFNVIHEHDLGSFNLMGGGDGKTSLGRKPRLKINNQYSNGFAHMFERDMGKEKTEEQTQTKPDEEKPPTTPAKNAVSQAVVMRWTKQSTGDTGDGIGLEVQEGTAPLVAPIASSDLDTNGMVGRQMAEEEERKKTQKSPQELIREQEDSDSLSYKIGSWLFGE